MAKALHKLLVKSMPDTRKARSRYIKKKLSPFIGMSFDCPALNTSVKIVGKSVKETRYNAQISKESTLLAKNLPSLFKRAIVLSHDRDVKAHPERYSKTFMSFGFDEAFVLKSVHDLYGTAKIVVGKAKRRNAVHYSVTSLFIKK